MTFTDLLIVLFMALAALAFVALVDLVIGITQRSFSAGAGSAESATRTVAEGSVPAETTKEVT